MQDERLAARPDHQLDAGRRGRPVPVQAVRQRRRSPAVRGDVRPAATPRVGRLRRRHAPRVRLRRRDRDPRAPPAEPPRDADRPLQQLPRGNADGSRDKEDVTGQLQPIDQHIWGVANSFRFADVWFGTGYKTVGFLTEGPGGDLVAAIDITHLFPGYPTATPAVPRTRTTTRRSPSRSSGRRTRRTTPASSAPGACPRSRPTRSPRAGCSSAPASTRRASSRRPSTRPRSSWIRRTERSTRADARERVLALAARGPAVLRGRVFFADEVVRIPARQRRGPELAGGPQRPGLVQLRHVHGLAELRRSASTSTTRRARRRRRSTSGAARRGRHPRGGGAPPSPQPIYYSPAATGQGTSGCQLYALASGSLYETSPTVSGWNVNRTARLRRRPRTIPRLPSFTPYLYLAVGPKKVTDGTFTSVLPLGKDPNQQYVIRQLIGGEVADAIPLPAGDPALLRRRSDEARAAHAGHVLAAHGRRQHGHREGEGDLPPLRSGFRLQRHVVRRDPDVPLGFDVRRARRVFDRDARSRPRRRRAASRSRATSSSPPRAASAAARARA